MKKYFAMIVTLLVIMSGMILVPAQADAADGDADKFNRVCSEELADDPVCQTVNDNRNLGTVAQNIINVVLSIIGVIAVIVIVVAGQRIMTSAGDPGKLKMAKDMLTWGIVGMVVALLAYVIVNFVIMSVPNPSGSSGSSSSTEKNITETKLASMEQNKKYN